MCQALFLSSFQPSLTENVTDVADKTATVFQTQTIFALAKLDRSNSKGPHMKIENTRPKSRTDLIAKFKKARLDRGIQR